MGAAQSRQSLHKAETRQKAHVKPLTYSPTR